MQEERESTLHLIACMAHAPLAWPLNFHKLSLTCPWLPCTIHVTQCTPPNSGSLKPPFLPWILKTVAPVLDSQEGFLLSFLSHSFPNHVLRNASDSRENFFLSLMYPVTLPKFYFFCFVAPKNFWNVPRVSRGVKNFSLWLEKILLRLYIVK